jgi:lysyl-tRNA synthetase class 2
MNPLSTSKPAFAPSATWEILELRANLLRRLRNFFDQRGFLEVETPLLSKEVIADRHLEPFRTVLARHPQPGDTLWLQTSPEAGMKRLMAAGGEAIYQITRSFRNGERGSHHNPEFSIVEWYRSGDSAQDGMQLLSCLSAELLGSPPAEYLSYREAFLRHAHIDPFTAGLRELSEHPAAGGLPPENRPSSDRDAWLDLILIEQVQPHLGARRPTIVYDYPASQAALARVRDETPPVAERFELFVRGIELANGYHELADADELMQRIERINAQRAAEGRCALPPPTQLLEAMRHGLPDCTGVALGFDRLLLLAASAKTLDDVLAFPVERA